MTGPKTNERPGTRALLRSAPMSAFKVREVLDLIRGQEVGRAAEILEFCERGAADAVAKVLASAVANAAHNDELDPEELYVAACYADEGRTQRRMRPRARGRATRIRKRSAHITVIVSRLPEERLARLRAKRAAEQAARRGRRGRGASASRRRRRQSQAEAPVEAPVAALPEAAPADGVELADEEIAAEEFAAEEAEAEEEAAADAEAEAGAAADAEAEAAAAADAEAETGAAADEEADAAVAEEAQAIEEEAALDEAAEVADIEAENEGGEAEGSSK
jgi:large subunit ribosomal protein L22